MKRYLHPQKNKIKLILNDGSTFSQSFTLISNESKTALSVLDITSHSVWNINLLNTEIFLKNRNKRIFLKTNKF